MSMYVYNPTAGPVLKELRMAKRSAVYEGKVLGIIDNGKKNSDAVLKFLAERIKEKFQLREVIHHKKSSFSHGLTESEAAKLAEQCDLVISGVGD